MSKELIEMVDTLIAHVNGAHTSTSASWADANWQAADRVLEKVQSRIKEDEAKFLQTHNWLCDRNETIAEQTKEIAYWKRKAEIYKVAFDRKDSSWRDIP